MAIYEFGCPECREKVELMLPMRECNSHPECPGCGSSMNRLVELPQRAVVPATGTDRALASLNARDDGIGNKPHIKQALWKGLSQRPEVVGRGF